MEVVIMRILYAASEALPFAASGGLADGAGLVRPLVPDLGVEVMDVVGLLLPDPQQLVHRRFPVGPPQGQDGEFLLQVIAVHDAEFLDGVGGGAVLPVGANVPVGVPDAVFQDVPAILNETDIGVAHGAASFFLVNGSIADMKAEFHSLFDKERRNIFKVLC